MDRKIVYVEKTIPERLAALYDADEAEKAGREINELIERYRQRIQSRPYHLSEKDIILITYGDQIHRGGEATLATLRAFLNAYVKDAINSVHILPFYPYSSDDGFSVIDYLAVNPRLGRWKNIEDMRDDGYRLMFDCVINHISQHSDWFRGYLRGELEYTEFFTDLDPTTDLSSVVRPRTTPLLTDFTDASGRQRAIWCTFSPDQIDLNYANYRVLVKVLDVLFQYVMRGAVLIRLDAIAFVWKEIGTGCVHLPQTHELIQLMREVLHAVAPEVIIITETNVPHKENISYFGNGGDEAQMVYNFALPPLLAFSLLRGDTTVLTEWARTLELPSDKVCFFNFTASHDGVGVRPVSDILAAEELRFLVNTCESHGGRVSYRAMGDGTKSPYELNCSYIDLLTHPEESDELRVARMLVAQAVVLAMPGVPGIYVHSLVGSRNDHAGMERSGINRSINREKFEWERLVQELEDPENLRHHIFFIYRRLIQIRTNEKAFDPFGPFAFPDAPHGVFAIRQTSADGSEEVLALHNFTGRKKKCTVPEAFHSAFDLVGERRNSGIEFEITPYQVAWLKKH